MVIMDEVARGALWVEDGFHGTSGFGSPEILPKSWRAARQV
jgi:hypothetical protein